MSAQHNICVLISGSGSNLQALIDATQPPSGTAASLPNVIISHVISNRRTAYGLTRAEKANIATTYHNILPYKKKHPSTEDGLSAARREYDADLAQIIVSQTPKPELVVCAGWMHILSSPFLRALDEAQVMAINLHPALPGQFNGTHAIDRAYEAFQKGEIRGSGVTVHRVIEAVDEGEPLVIQEIEFREGESLDDFEQRVHEAEWGVIVEATKKALEGSTRTA